MKIKTFPLLGLLFLLALDAQAGTRACNATLVTQGVCRSTSDVVYALSISTTDPDGAGPLQAPSALLLDAFAADGGWSATMLCTAEMSAGGLCSAGQIGTVLAISKSAFADFRVRRYVLSVILSYRLQQAAAAAAASALAAADPDIGN